MGRQRILLVRQSSFWEHRNPRSTQSLEKRRRLGAALNSPAVFISTSALIPILALNSSFVFIYGPALSHWAARWSSSRPLFRFNLSLIRL
jgi:hypothetical protein